MLDQQSGYEILSQMDSSPWPSAPPALWIVLSELDDSARHAFDYFRFCAYQTYKRRGYPVLWADQALSTAMSEPAVFFALAASGAAEQAVTECVNTTLVRSTKRCQSDMAIDLYSRALHHLQLPMQKAIAEQGSLTPVILSCLVFVIYETTFGTHLNAMRHARTGFSILEERLQRSPRLHDPWIRYPKQPQRLHGTAAPQRDAPSRPRCSRTVSSFSRETSELSLDSMQRRLEALTEIAQDIRCELQALAERSSQLSATGSQLTKSCLIYTMSRIINIDAALQTRMATALKGFQSLSQDLRQVLASTEHISEHPSLLFMQIRCFHASLSLAMSRGLNEKLTDFFADDITRTLDNAERLIRLSFMGTFEIVDENINTGPIADEFMSRLFAAEHPCLLSTTETTIAQGPLPVVQRRDKVVAGIFEFGILPALYLIACKCRTSSHRRRAARLLHEANRVEAINSSATLAAYADAVIHVEEQSALRTLQYSGAAHASDSYPELYADEVPKTARFLDVVVTAAESAVDAVTPQQSWRLELACTRLVEEDGNRFELLKCWYDKHSRRCGVEEVETFSARDFG